MTPVHRELAHRKSFSAWVLGLAARDGFAADSTPSRRLTALSSGPDLVGVQRPSRDRGQGQHDRLVDALPRATGVGA